jgi:CHAP domain-containing protein
MDRSAKLLAFIAPLLGRKADAPSGEGGQCVDLANLWGAALGASHVWANAIDWPTKASRLEWEWVPNEPANYPLPGDVVIWRTYAPLDIGLNGHCAIALAASPKVLLVAEQNWDGLELVSAHLHGYGGVAGWLRRLP